MATCSTYGCVRRAGHRGECGPTVPERAKLSTVTPERVIPSKPKLGPAPKGPTPEERAAAKAERERVKAEQAARRAETNRRSATRAWHRRREAEVAHQNRVACQVSKDDAPCCQARRDELGRLPIGYCSPECIRRPPALAGRRT